jgi:hypothetical protein
MSRKIESIEQINIKTEEGRLLLIAIGRISYYESKSTPEEVLKILNTINNLVRKEENTDDQSETDFPDDRESN